MIERFIFLFYFKKNLTSGKREWKRNSGRGRPEPGSSALRLHWRWSGAHTVPSEKPSPLFLCHCLCPIRVSREEKSLTLALMENSNSSQRKKQVLLFHCVESEELARKVAAHSDLINLQTIKWRSPPSLYLPTPSICGWLWFAVEFLWAKFRFFLGERHYFFSVTIHISWKFTWSSFLKGFLRWRYVSWMRPNVRK